MAGYGSLNFVARGVAEEVMDFEALARGAAKGVIDFERVVDLI